MPIERGARGVMGRTAVLASLTSSLLSFLSHSLRLGTSQGLRYSEMIDGW